LAENYTKHPGNSADYSREYGEIWGETPMGEEFWAVFDSFFKIEFFALLNSLNPTTPQPFPKVIYRLL
jgi:hypothetical protein